MDSMNPAVIFAALAIIFAILNLVLWTMVWKDNTKSKDIEYDISSEALDKIKDAAASADGNNSKLEDQLWGILDKLKDLEEKLPAELSGGVSKETNQQIVQTAKLSKKSAKMISEELKEIKSVKENLESLSEKIDDIDKFNDMFESLDGSIAKFNSRIKKLIE